MSQPKISRYILADTGFWLGLCDHRDGRAKDSAAIYQSLERFKVVLPWPVIYEVLRTCSVRQPLVVERFEKALRSTEVYRIDDSPYRVRALEATLESAQRRRRAISLVDMVLRLMIDDAKIRIDAVITYNVSDFFDMCRRRQIPVISQPSGMTAFSEM